MVSRHNWAGQVSLSSEAAICGILLDITNVKHKQCSIFKKMILKKLSSVRKIEHIVRGKGLNILQRERIPFSRRFG